jgi:hypothetical protein
MEPTARVCPFCGEPPGEGVFCAACGRNLSEVERLPTREEWAAEARAADGAPAADAGSLAERCAAATAAFLDEMRAAGNPGAVALTTDKRPMFRKPPQIQGWILRPVDREDFEEPHRYEPGLVLAVDGRFHSLDSELRGWGQRDFPRYEETVSHDPIDPPADERLLEELRAARDG